MKPLYADLILPLPVPNLYTYRVPGNLTDKALPGRRAVVQFGKRKTYSAIIRKLHNKAPHCYKAKDILQVLDEEEIISEKLLQFWEWMSVYYMCHIGEVMLAALPSGLRISGETQLLLNRDVDSDVSQLGRQELLILEALHYRKTMNMQEISELLDKKAVYHHIKKLLDSKVVRIEERIRQKYQPKKSQHVFPAEVLYEEENLKNALQELTHAPAQMRIMLKLIQLCHLPSKRGNSIKRSRLLKESSSGSQALNQLESKGWIKIKELEESRLGFAEEKSGRELSLSSRQRLAYDQICMGFASGKPVLLHGVTSSGKTELYIRLIQDALDRGEQALYLLPEIALTAQIISRLKQYFGDQIGVYHSRLNQNERVEVWQKVLENGCQCRVILGARSAIFLPFGKLGLIVIDEEHDPSYKQQDPAPRYQGRDAALMLATFYEAHVILGSATPSLETYWHASQGKLHLVELSERYRGMEMPRIHIVDLRKAYRKKQMKSHFSPLLLEGMQNVLKQGKQVILFRNRRGFSHLLLCSSCGWIPVCRNCDVSMTYHKQKNKLRCHYCGYNESSPWKCPACGDTDLRMIGYGTEQTEEELALLLPHARVARMDRDTTSGKDAHHKLIMQFEDRQVDVLVGTQMISKGLDFDHVGLVGILHADQMLHFPDFRSYERGFQMMMQVAGRAGRKGERGEVIIQTFNPEHQVIKMVQKNDYKTHYDKEIKDRKQFKYPPFFRLIRISVRQKDFHIVNDAANHLAAELRKAFGSRVLGPEFPPIPRVRNLYDKNILLKIERNISHTAAKKGLASVIESFKKEKQRKNIRLIIDVDPV